ncbi:transcription factor 23-like [Littorina saxatilis]|uniref:transcription factor 23-like n=1 Tax=Littorina saxatilis TaxID=31220 RepID=UPI0038B58ABB
MDMESTFTHTSAAISKIVQATEQVGATADTWISPSPEKLHLQTNTNDDNNNFSPHNSSQTSCPHDHSPHSRCSQTAGGSSVRANSNAARERSRVKTLRAAFLDLQRTLPAVPQDTKLSKLDVLVLATTYIAHLTTTLSKSSENNTYNRQHQRSIHHEEAVFSPAKSSSTSQATGNYNSEIIQGASFFPQTADTRASGCHERRGIAEREVSHTRVGGVLRGAKSHCVSGLRSHGYLHPVKKWPMRTRLYAGIMASARGARKTSSYSKCNSS